MADIVYYIIKGIAFVVFCVIFVMIEEIRKKVERGSKKQAWTFLSAGSFIYVLAALFELLGELDKVSIFFEYSGEIVLFISLCLIFWGIFKLRFFSDEGRKKILKRS